MLNGSRRVMMRAVIEDAEDPRLVVERGYDRLGQRFVEWTDHIEQPLKAEFARLATERLPATAVVADLGCGPITDVGRELSRRLRYVGVDRSVGMLRLARERVPRAALVRADMTAPVFRPCSVDAAVAFFSLIHVPREQHLAALTAVARLLRPGGRFAASLGTHDLPGKVHPQWLGSVEMFWSFFDAETNLRLVADAGFEIERAIEADQVEDGKLVPFLWVLARRD